MFCELNLYELDLTFNKAYKKKIFTKESDTISILKKEAYKNYSILFNYDEFLSYKQIDTSYEEIDFNSLSEYYQIQLIQLFLRKELNLFKNLSKFLPKKEFDNFLLLRKIEGNVFKFDKFYLSLDIKQEVVSKYTLLEEIQFHKNLIGKQVKSIYTDSIGTIEKVTFENEDDYKKRYEYITNYFKKNLPKEPIIDVKFDKNQKAYYYLASHLRIYYSSKDFKENIVIPNFQRKSLIESAIKSANLGFLKPVAYRKKFLKFNSVKFKGFKEVNFLKDLVLKSPNFNVIYPKRIPKILENNPVINTIILADKNINFSNTPYIKFLFNGLKAIHSKSNIKFELVNKNDFKVDFNTKNILQKVLNYKSESVIPSLVILIASKRDSYYEDTKRKLFKYGFISQNIIYPNLLKNGYFELNNLLLQILVKYGMYPFTIDISHSYDYILGVDVGNDRYGNRNIAGGISVINKYGILEKLIPIKVLTNGEKIDLSLFLEELSVHLNLKNKSLLLLRDGKLTKSEKESIIKEFNNLELKRVTFLNIVKRHNLRIYDDNEGRKGVILKDNLALLLAHKIKGARAVKIDVKSVIEDGKIKDLPITKEDLELLFRLTNLNYSNLYLYSQRLRLPSPVHYADKFVKALGKDWMIKEELLLNGFLYFL